jgi:putative ABC transport system permease protein
MAFSTEQMRQNLAGVAGVTSATGIAIYSPLSGAVNVSLEVEGSSVSEQRSQFIPILPDYFKTLGVRVLQGREFGPRDTADNLPVAVINDVAARRFFQNESPLGKQIQIQSPQLPGEPSRQVIGVVTEVAQYSFQEGRPQLYVPYSQIGTINDEQLSAQLRAMTLITRTRRPAPEMAASFASAVTAADRNQAISAVRTMEQTAYAGPARRRVFVELVGLFGAIAVILAVAGVYGVMSNVVSQRFTEFGIRIALGARPREIRHLVIRRGRVLIGTGLLLGVVVSLAMTRVLRSFLFGASATDPLTFVVGILLLGGVAFLACYIPAWRASRIDALGALRHY